MINFLSAIVPVPCSERLFFLIVSLIDLSQVRSFFRCASAYSLVISPFSVSSVSDFSGTTRLLPWWRIGRSVAWNSQLGTAAHQRSA